MTTRTAWTKFYIVPPETYDGIDNPILDAFGRTPEQLVEEARAAVAALTDTPGQLHRSAVAGRPLVVHVHGWDRWALDGDGGGPSVCACAVSTSTAHGRYATQPPRRRRSLRGAGC